VAQARRFGVEILSGEVKALCVQDQYRIVKLSSGAEISCHALLIATGVSYSRLNIPGLEKLTGAGVYYGAAMTEALSCRENDVYVVGGANSAGQAAMYFSKFARRVIMLVRGPSLTASMSQYLIDEIESHAEYRGANALASRSSASARTRWKNSLLNTNRVLEPRSMQTFYSYSSAPSRAPIGWKALCRATRKALSSPARN
jgi:thioredoxin reductase